MKKRVSLLSPTKLLNLISSIIGGAFFFFENMVDGVEWDHTLLSLFCMLKIEYILMFLFWNNWKILVFYLLW